MSDRAAEISRRYASGERIKTIASDYGLTLDYVSKIAQANGQKPRHKRAKLGPSPKSRQILDAYASGKPLKVIAWEFGVSMACVSMVALRYGPVDGRRRKSGRSGQLPGQEAVPQLGKDTAGDQALSSSRRPQGRPHAGILV